MQPLSRAAPGAGAADAAEPGTSAFAALAAADIRPDAVFFHKFYSAKAAKQPQKQQAAGPDDDSDASDAEIGGWPASSCGLTPFIVAHCGPLYGPQCHTILVREVGLAAVLVLLLVNAMESTQQRASQLHSSCSLWHLPSPNSQPSRCRLQTACLTRRRKPGARASMRARLQRGTTTRRWPTPLTRPPPRAAGAATATPPQVRLGGPGFRVHPAPCTCPCPRQPC